MKKKSRSQFSPFKLVLLLTLTTLSVKAIGYLRTDEDLLSASWGMPLDRHLSALHTSAKLDEKHTPWADFNWPARKGSIGSRWLDGDADPLKFRTVPLKELTALSPEARRSRVKKLSPAEKLDIVRMLFSYPLLNQVRTDLKRANADADLQAGWAIAATHLVEPSDTVVTVKVPNAHDPRSWVEVDVPFASSDVKALLAYYFGTHAAARVKRYQAGSNCSGMKVAGCSALDPASFHVLLSNMIGKLGRSFILELPTGSDSAAPKLSPRPVVAYESDVRYQQDGRYRVTTKVEVARIRAPQWSAYEFYNLDTEPVFYEYTLEVNTRGEIVRGHWLSEQRPEIAWRSDLPAVDKDFRALAEQIYHPVKKTRDLSAIESLFE